MEHVAFIGVGHMGGPMAANLLKAGYTVTAYDISADLTRKLAEQGARAVASVAAAVAEADIVITMLPEGKHVVAVYTEVTGILNNAPQHALLIDCSTIDVATARTIHDAAAAAGYSMLDAPVSGGTAGAAAGTLTFMVGGTEPDYARAQTLLSAMGKKIFYTGPAGNGQAAKICNNMLLGISMIGTCEALGLAAKLGLDAQTFFDICSVSSGQCWSLTTYCPVPGPGPTSPANKNYEAGFMAKMMLKDLKLAQQAAETSQASTPLAALSTVLYNMLCQSGAQEKDFSFMMEWLQGHK